MVWYVKCTKVSRQSRICKVSLLATLSEACVEILAGRSQNNIGSEIARQRRSEQATLNSAEEKLRSGTASRICRMHMQVIFPPLEMRVRHDNSQHALLLDHVLRHQFDI